MLRPRLLALALAVAVPAAGMVPRDAAADFDPAGRKKRRAPPAKGGKGAQPAGGRPAPGATRPRAPDATPGTEGRGAASSEALIARYTAIALAQPGAPFPLERLAQLHRERDGNLKKLAQELEQRVAAAGPDAWAARVVLAGVYRQDGRHVEAARAYEAAIDERPSDPAARLALARLLADRGEREGARRRYEEALPLLKAQAEVEQVTRALLALALDARDLDAARRHHAALVKLSGGSLFVRAELGRELLARGELAGAEAEFREVVQAASGDNRALAPALRDLGVALARQKKAEEALRTLQRALAVAGGAAGIRADILSVITEVYRGEGRLGELIALLEAERGTDFQRAVLLGALYEETGQVDRAIAAYRRALARNGRHIDTRVKLVHLLQAAGALDEAVREYEALIRAAPGNPTFVFELCETLIQRGDRPRAIRLLGELERRAARDAEVLASLADFYERVEEKARALAVLQRLAAGGGGDPRHLIDLGDRYFQAGDRKKALETWARIKLVVPNRARAAATLGEVYLDHDMPAEALASLREATQLEPTSVRYKKIYAVALERTASGGPHAAARYEEAKKLWEEILAGASGDKALAREARTHIVALWGLLRELPARVAPLETAFGATPPDLEAGRLLAEVLRRLGRLPLAEAALRRLVRLAPGDDEAFLALERVLVQQQNLAGAIEVLERLVEIDPKRAREFYQRMAQYAAELYRDDDAVRYASRAVELSPDDAAGHQKLAHMYRRRQDIPKAIAEYRAALAKNDRLYPVYLDLAELLLARGEVDEADRLFRRVVRAAPDEELVARAARMSLQINLGRGTLESLERELLPVALGHPQKLVYRRLLVELYGAMTFGLVQRVRRGDAADAERARAELSRVGTRAVKPLLDALADEKEAQQRVAIEVLAHVENRSAGPALFGFATGSADKDLRLRAMVACGALRDPALLSRYEALLAPPGEAGAGMAPDDAIAVAAAWGVARLGDRRAERLLVRLLEIGSPEVRALAALGLGLTRDRAHTGRLVEVVRAAHAGGTARAAAALALAELEAPSAGEALLALADAPEPVARRAALLALGRLAPAGAIEAIAAGVFAEEESLRDDAVAAAQALATRSYRVAGEPLPVPAGAVSVQEILLARRPSGYGADDRARALATFAAALRKEAVAAVTTSPTRARLLADALLAGRGAPALAPFTDGIDEATAARRREALEAAESIAAATVSGFVPLVAHPDVEVRTRAAQILARRNEPEAERAIAELFGAGDGDAEEAARRAALGALGPSASARIVEAVVRLLREEESWSLRVRAAEALGRVTATPKSLDALASAARGDGYALVREAALRALAALDRDRAVAVLREARERDVEPRVREAARALLGGSP